MTDRYAVIGHPVAHSLSPEIHHQFARQTGQNLSYSRLEAPVDGFATTAEQFFTNGGAGLNVTVPFKGDACAWVNRLDAAALEAQAVNTIVVENGTRVGYNTDGVGLVNDLRAQGAPLEGAEVLILGAGGATRGVLNPLLAAGVAEISIANRTLARASALADQFERVAACSLDRAPVGCALVINATSAGLEGQAALVDPDCVRNSWCYDMLYSREGDTPFCAWVRDAGAARTSDGLGMLVEQAAAAFELWRGATPDGRAVLDDLRGGQYK